MRKRILTMTVAVGAILVSFAAGLGCGSERAIRNEIVDKKVEAKSGDIEEYVNSVIYEDEKNCVIKITKTKTLSPDRVYTIKDKETGKMTAITTCNE